MKKIITETSLHETIDVKDTNVTEGIIAKDKSDRFLGTIVRKDNNYYIVFWSGHTGTEYSTLLALINANPNCTFYQL